MNTTDRTSVQDSERLLAAIGKSEQLAQIGTYYVDVASNKPIFSLGFLHIFSAVKEFKSLEDTYRLLSASDSQSLKSFRDNAIKHFNEKNPPPILRTQYQLLAENGEPQRLVKESISPHYHSGRLDAIVGTLEYSEVERQRNSGATTLDLEESEKLVGLGTWEFDIIHNIQRWSAGQCALYEVDINEMPADFKAFIDFVHPDDRDIFTFELQQLMNPEHAAQVKEHVFRIIGKRSKKSKTIKSFVSPVIQDGRVVAFKGTNQDISHYYNLIDQLTQLNLDLKQEREKLEDVKKELEDSQEIAQVGSWYIDRVNEAYIWSDGLKRIFGVSLETIPSHELYIAHIHPDDLSEALRAFQNLPSFFEHNPDAHFYGGHRIVSHSTNSVKYISAITKAVFKDNLLIGMKGIIRDITKEQIAFNLLKNSEEKFANVFTHSGVGMAILSSDGDILDANKFFIKLCEYTFEELLSKNCSSLTHPKDYSEKKKKMDSLIRGEITAYELNNRLITKNGSIRWVTITASLMTDISTQTKYIIAQYQDITKRIESEKKVFEYQQKFISAFHGSSVSMIITDLDGRIIEVNEAACQFLAYKKKELIHKDVCVFYHPDDVANHREKFASLLNGEIDGYTIQKRFFDANQEVKYGLLTVNLIKDENGVANGVIDQIQDISSLKREQAFRMESEERFKLLVESAHIGIGFSKYEKLIYANPALLEILGFSSFEEYGQNTLFDIATPHTKEFLVDRINKLRNGIKVKEVFKGDFYTKQGAVKTLEVQTKTIRIGNEDFRIGIISDLTERLLLEKNLFETKRVFDQAQKFTHMGSWRWTLSTDELFWSDSTFALFGLPKGDNKVNYELFINLVHPDDREKVETAIADCVTRLSPYETEHRIIGKNGKVRWMLEKGNVIRDKEGKAIEMYGIVRDITQEKQVEEELKKSKEKYQLLAESGQELISLHALDGTFVYTSPAIRTLLGYNPKSVNDKVKAIDLVHPKDHGKLNVLLKNASKKKGKVVSGRVRLLHKVGHYIWCEMNLKALHGEDGSIQSVRALTRNIENQVAFENRLQETNTTLEHTLDELKKASQAKEDFLSVMSHEIRTPLNSVIGLSNLLLKRSPRDDQFDLLQTLKGSADNLMHLVTDILDFSKIRAGKVELEIIPFSLSKFLQQLHASFYMLAMDKGLAFSIQADPLIPDVLEGDVTRLNQIFNNLLSNAIKFTRKGHVKLCVEATQIESNQCTLQFHVEDTGVGIAPEKADIIFEPFSQSERETSRKYGGTGLGLSIVKSLVDILKGKVSLESVPKKITVFTVSLDFSIPAEAIVPHKNVHPSRQSLYGNIRVLYVEDVESNRFLIENIFTDHGMQCKTAHSGKIALNICQKESFDVILMDLQMPGMDGYETTLKIRQQRNGQNTLTPILAFTAEPYTEDLRKKVVAKGFQEVITKPFNTEILLDKISHFARIQRLGSTSFSFSFYEDIFDSDAARIRGFITLLVKELEETKEELKECVQEKKLKNLRDSLHRIRPILRNIQAKEAVDLIEMLYSYSEFNEDVVMHCAMLEALLKKVIGRIGELSY